MKHCKTHHVDTAPDYSKWSCDNRLCEIEVFLKWADVTHFPRHYLIDPRRKTPNALQLPL